MTAADRITAQLAFVLELDKAKQVIRQNPLADGSRRENDAEHMWHIAVMALVLAEHADEPIDVLRVLTMLLLHDVVEIDAGDVFVYDDAARAGKVDAERLAADRLYGMLPDDQRGHFRAAWEEFEAGVTPEARFAAALDRLQPLLLNAASGGGAWAVHGITADRVRERNAPIGAASAPLWDAARTLIDEAVAAGSISEPATAELADRGD